jgi:hypothetical protein
MIKNSNISDKLEKEYSSEFDEKRKNRVFTSFYKYGSAEKNYKRGNIQALPTMQLCIEKYNQTGNTEYLADAANYIMFEYMYPQHPNAHFTATDSNGSAGIVGISEKELEEYSDAM